MIYEWVRSWLIKIKVMAIIMLLLHSFCSLVRLRPHFLSHVDSNSKTNRLFFATHAVVQKSKIKMSLNRAMKDSHKLPRVYVQPFQSSADSTLGRYFEIDNKIDLNSNIMHYLRNVLRLKIGDYFRVFNEIEGEYLCIFEKLAPSNSNINQLKRNNHFQEDFPIVKCKIKDSHVSIDKNSIIQNIDVVLHFAPIKKPRMKQQLESCTEIGVKSFQPVVTQNCNTDYTDYEQFKTLLIETIEQSEQFQIPRIYKSINIHTLLNNWINTHKSNSNKNYNIPPLFICCERLESKNLKFLNSSSPTMVSKDLSSHELDLHNNKNDENSSFTHSNIDESEYKFQSESQKLPSLSMTEIIENTLFLNQKQNLSTTCNSTSTSTNTDSTNMSINKHNTFTLRSLSEIPMSCGVLIGPEGGFTKQEILMFQNSEYSSFVHFVSLGPEVLRAETAAVYAVSVIKSIIMKYQSIYQQSSNSVHDQKLTNMRMNSNVQFSDRSITTIDKTNQNQNINNNNDNNNSITPKITSSVSEIGKGDDLFQSLDIDTLFGHNTSMNNKQKIQIKQQSFPNSIENETMSHSLHKRKQTTLLRSKIAMTRRKKRDS